MSAHPRRWRTVGAIACAVALAAAACSIPVDETARPVDDTPEDLFATTTVMPETAVDEESEFSMPLFFYNDEDGLVHIDRQREEAPTVQQLLDALALSPTEEELAANPGIATRFLPEMNPQAVDRSDDGLLTVVVGGPELRERVETNPDRVKWVYTQIVCSMVTLVSIISSVQINDTEGPIRVQGQDGAVIERAVTAEDVNNCKTAEEVAAEAAEAAEDADSESTTTTSS